MEKILTVTVPAYNAEKFLSTCLDSLCLPDVIGDLDVIVINDGSKDGTASVGEQYAARFPGSVRMISKENGGHGSGINRGIREAQGVYFRVIDADDWADPAGLRSLLSYLRQTLKQHRTPDLVSSQFLWAFDRGEADVRCFRTKAQFSVPFEGVEYEKIYRFEEIADKVYIKFHNLTVRTALLRENSICLDEHCYYEDVEYVLYPALRAQTAAFTEQPVYMYRIGNAGQSMSREKLLKNASNYDRVMDSLLRVYAEEKDRLPAGIRKFAARFIARFAAGSIKISLMMPAGNSSLARIRSLDARLREDYPEIYEANINAGVALLRKTGYAAYLPAVLAVRLRGIV